MVTSSVRADEWKGKKTSGDGLCGVGGCETKQFIIIIVINKQLAAAPIFLWGGIAIAFWFGSSNLRCIH